LNVQEILALYLPAVEAEMRAVLTITGDSILPFYGMMHYQDGLGGVSNSSPSRRAQARAFGPFSVSWSARPWVACGNALCPLRRPSS